MFNSTNENGNYRPYPTAVLHSIRHFEVYEAWENGLPNYGGGIVTHEFLRELADHLKAEEELDIQTAGFTKCRFPVLAKRYIVRDGEVLHADLSSLESIEK